MRIYSKPPPPKLLLLKYLIILTSFLPLSYRKLMTRGLPVSTLPPTKYGPYRIYVVLQASCGRRKRGTAMFKLQTDYALRTLIYLAHTNEQASVQEIATAYGISRD